MRDFTGVSGASGGLADNDTRWTPEVGNAIVQEICNLVRDPEGGNAALDPESNTQLLDAVLRMLGGGRIFNPDADTLVIGSWMIKRGQHRAYAASESTVAIAFPTAFPTTDPYVLSLTGVIDVANTARDLWPQRITSASDRFGFTVQYQSDDGSNTGIYGFDWIAIGKAA